MAASTKSGLISKAASKREAAIANSFSTSSKLAAVAIAAPGFPPSSAGGSLPPSIFFLAEHMCTLPQLKVAIAAASWNFFEASDKIPSGPLLSSKLFVGSNASEHLSKPSE